MLSIEEFNNAPGNGNIWAENLLHGEVDIYIKPRIFIRKMKLMDLGEYVKSAIYVGIGNKYEPEILEILKNVNDGDYPYITLSSSGKELECTALYAIKTNEVKSKITITEHSKTSLQMIVKTSSGKILFDKTSPTIKENKKEILEVYKKLMNGVQTRIEKKNLFRAEFMTAGYIKNYLDKNNISYTSTLPNVTDIEFTEHEYISCFEKYTNVVIEFNFCIDNNLILNDPSKIITIINTMQEMNKLSKRISNENHIPQQ